MVYINFKDLDGLKKQAEQGAAWCFTGKQVIHPQQVPIVQAAFSPSACRTRLLSKTNRAHQLCPGSFFWTAGRIDGLHADAVYDCDLSCGIRVDYGDGV